MKLLIAGYSRHGKDTVCELIKERLGLSYISSSDMALKLFMFEKLKELYGYSTIEDAINDKEDKRDIWYELICEYNKLDKSRLGKEIFKSYDIYCGIRDFEEYKAIIDKKLFDYSIWVDASKRVQVRHHGLTEEQFSADFTINNNGSIQDLKTEVNNLCDFIIDLEEYVKNSSRY